MTSSTSSPSDDSTPRQLYKKAEVLLETNPRETARLAQQALGLAEAAGDLSTAARALNLLADVDRMEGRPEVSFETTQRALAQGRKANDEWSQAYSISNLGALAWHRGELDLAAKWFTEAMEIRDRIGEKGGVAGCCSNLSLIYCEKGDLKKALELQQRSLSIREELGDRNGVATSHINLGLVHMDLGDWDRALESYFRALAEKERIGDKAHMALCHNNIGETYLYRGKLDRARFHLELAMELAESVHATWVLVEILGTLGEVAFESGDYARAQVLYERDKALCDQTEDREELAETLRRWAELDLARGETEQAEARLNTAMELCRDVGARRELGNGYRVLGELHAREGRPDESSKAFDRSAEILKSLGDNYELGVALLSAGRWKVRQGRAGEDELKHALGIFRQLSVLNRAREAEEVLKSSPSKSDTSELLQDLTRLATRGMDTASFCERAVQVIARQLDGSDPTLFLRDGTTYGAGRTTRDVTGERATAYPLEVGGRRLGSLAVFEARTALQGIVEIVALGLAQSRTAPARLGPTGKPDREAGRDFEFPGVVGADGSLADVFDTVRRVAPTKASVLVLGESGTGKELVARALHQLSAGEPAGSASTGKPGPFVAVNCAAIPENLLEGELFGIEKGTATGVVERKGRFETAAGGTLFLDEVGDMSPALQSKLLRVLQERVFERVGGRQLIESDVRIVAATNKRLEEEIAAGRFRQDLFFRLNVVSVTLPPLRERRADIPRLVGHFVRDVSREYERPVKGVTEAALSCLLEHAWPGNVRELENVVERGVILARGDLVDVDDLPAELRRGTGPDAGWQTARKQAEMAAAGQIERKAVLDALETNGWVVKRAAEKLGISRRQLYRILQKHGIERPAG